MKDIILASASGIRLKILNDFGFNVKVEAANIDEDEIKNSLLAEKFSSFDISRALAETKAKKISSKIYDQMILGADQVLDFGGNIFNKPENMELAMNLMNPSGKRNLTLGFSSSPSFFGLINSKTCFCFLVANWSNSFPNAPWVP